MQQVVIVVAVHERDVLVSSDQGGCQGCEAKLSCAVMGGSEKANLHMSVPNRLMASVGDRVVLDIDDHALLRATFLLYGLPMLAFISFGSLAYAFADAMQWVSVDLWAVAGAVIGMFMVWRLSAVFDVQPVVTMLRFDSGEVCPTTKG